MQLRILIFIFAITSFINTPMPFAQQGDDEVEALYDRFDTDETVTRQKTKRKKKTIYQKPKTKRPSVSDLVELAPFEDIAVIQRRYLPRTKRFEFSGSPLFTTNNAFFTNLGLELGMAYYFKEAYGLEFKYRWMTSSAKDVTENLEKNQKVDTKSFVEPKGYYGVSLKWSPIYGKVAWFDKSVIPFDIYFTPGIGMTTTALGKNEITFNVGTGQLFALSKSLAARWDFNWSFYQATVEESNGTTISENKKFHSDLILSVGISFFFPEATYR